MYWWTGRVVLDFRREFVIQINPKPLHCPSLEGASLGSKLELSVRYLGAKNRQEGVLENPQIFGGLYSKNS